MLTDIELKEKLIAKITDTDNVELLNELSRIIDFEEEVYIMSPEEIEAVKEGIEQIESGRFVTNEESDRRAEECLKG